MVMRCVSCNEALTDYEATRKYAETNEYLDLCVLCSSQIDDGLIISDRIDLKSNSDTWAEYGVKELDFDSLTFTNDFSEDYD
jgi:hypothetical protein